MLNSEKMKFLKILHGGLEDFDTPNYIEYFKEYKVFVLIANNRFFHNSILFCSPYPPFNLVIHITYMPLIWQITDPSEFKEEVHLLDKPLYALGGNHAIQAI